MAVLNAVRAGTIVIANGSGSNTATITSVTSANAFVIHNYNFSTAVAEDGLIKTVLTDDTTVTASRGTGTTTAVTVQYYVADFTSGVAVQRGASNRAAWAEVGSFYEDDITISSVGTTTAFALVYGVDDGATLRRSKIIQANITSATNLNLKADDTSTDLPYQTNWQVVDFTAGATVTTGTVAVAAADEIATATVSISDTNKAALFFSWMQTEDDSGSGLDHICFRGVITNSTTLTFTRVGDNTIAMDIRWYLVEWSTNANVKHGVASFGTGDTAIATDISTVTAANSIVVVSGFQNFLGTSAQTDGDFGATSFRATSLSDTSLTLTRAETNSIAAQCAFFVIDFSTTAAGVIKTFNGLAKASTKTVDGTAIASIKTVLGTANV